MLDLFTIFSKGGIVLWCFQGTCQSFTLPVNELIRSVILQVSFKRDLRLFADEVVSHMLQFGGFIISMNCFVLKGLFFVLLWFRSVEEVIRLLMVPLR